ncbi:CD1845 family protein [Mogibacterium diversum]|jgi:hypothetical protein|uniref:CD1845 family protein n=1 Tax=Mogibacterium diversum TaxID=114527 RepID=UPI0026F161D0|nr:CD1845 family protein [Mogibacterium diversum]
MTDYFKNIKIDLIGENLTDDSFLTEEGLRWTDKTEVELISGLVIGFLFSPYGLPMIGATVIAFIELINEKIKAL